MNLRGGSLPCSVSCLVEGEINRSWLVVGEVDAVFRNVHTSRESVPYVFSFCEHIRKGQAVLLKLIEQLYVFAPVFLERPFIRALTILMPSCTRKQCGSGLVLYSMHTAYICVFCEPERNKSRFSLMWNISPTEFVTSPPLRFLGGLI